MNGIVRLEVGVTQIGANMSENLATEDLEERKNAESVIADGLAELSQVETVPTEVDATTPFETEEVTFADGSWLDRATRVQDWLRLAQRIDPADALGVRATRLFESLGPTSMAEALVLEGDNLMVTQYGLGLLRDRIERALELKDKFLDNLEAGSTAAATSAWVEEWEETVESTISGPILAKASTWSISDFASKAKSGRLQLSPSYQRGDVWPTKDAQLLIESILRGIPLPSVIVLRPAKDADVPFEVVDGKQRLTSILRFMGAHPDALKTVKSASAKFPDSNLEGLFKSNYKQFRTAWKNATGETLTSSLEKEYYFPFKLSATSDALTGDLAPLAGKYYQEIGKVRVRVGGESLDVQEVFETTTDYKIPVIEYTEATPRQIHEVFNLYNKQGKHLNAEEIRNAVYHEVSVMRALSVASGDNMEIEAAAPFLLPVQDDVDLIRENLEGFGISDVRYRRSKVLSWLFSLLFTPPIPEGGKPSFLSTSQQINSLLDHVQSTPGAPLRDQAIIQKAITLVSSAMETHAASNAWADTFRNASGAKWQELQLVASLLGFSMASLVLDGDLESRVAVNREDIRRKSEVDWKRPSKTQTGRQWKYIATVSLAILEELDVDPSDAEKALSGEFGSSCVATLIAARNTIPD